MRGPENDFERRNPNLPASSHSEGRGPSPERSEPAPDFPEGTKRRRVPGPDVRIDLTTPDAVDRLTELGEALEKARTRRPDEFPEDTSEVTEADERELEGTLSEMDAGARENALDDMRGWLDRQCEGAIAELQAYRHAGYERDDILRLIDATAKGIGQELDRLNERLVRSGRRPFVRDVPTIKDELLGALDLPKAPPSNDVTRPNPIAPERRGRNES